MNKIKTVMVIKTMVISIGKPIGMTLLKNVIKTMNKRNNNNNNNDNDNFLFFSLLLFDYLK